MDPADPEPAADAGVRRAGHRGRPAAGERAGGFQLHDDHAGDGRLGIHVLHRCGAQPADGRSAGRDRVHPRPRTAGPRSAWWPSPAFAAVQVPPTTDADQLIEAINNFSTSRGTAIGSAILTSIDGIAAIDPTVAPTGVDAESAQRSGYAADVIVVLTDGANTQGVEPAEAAEAAAVRGVRVFTIGFGTTTPTRMACTGQQAGGWAGGGSGWRFRPGRGAQPAGHRRGRPAGRRRDHRGPVLPGRERRPAAGGAGRSAQPGDGGEEARRHRVLVCRRRGIARCGRRRALAVVEPSTRAAFGSLRPCRARAWPDGVAAHVWRLALSPSSAPSQGGGDQSFS